MESVQNLDHTEALFLKTSVNDEFLKFNFPIISI